MLFHLADAPHIWGHPCTSSHSPHPVYQRTVSALPSDYIQNQNTLHNLHCNHPVQATITCCLHYLRGLLSGICASTLAQHSVYFTRCIREVLSNHCPIFSLRLLIWPRANPNLSVALRSYTTQFPPTLTSSSSIVPLAYSTPAIQASLMLLPDTVLSQSLCQHCNFYLECHSPHVVMNPSLIIFKSLFKSHFIREVWPAHPAKIATSLQHSLISLFLCMALIITWRVIYLFIAFHHHHPSLEMEGPWGQGLCSLLYPHDQNRSWSISILFSEWIKPVDQCKTSGYRSGGEIVRSECQEARQDKQKRSYHERSLWVTPKF